MLYRVSREILRILISVLFRTHFFGRGNIPDPPYIVVSNHASLLDPPLVGIGIKKHNIDFMAKKELFDVPIIGTWTRLVGCIRVDRDTNSISSLKEALRRINRGRVVCIFPEGTRSADGDLQDAKRGVGFLIAKAGVPVVPVYIDGSGEALPRSGRIKAGTSIKVIIGRPILPDSFSVEADFRKKDYERITGMVMEHISQLKETCGNLCGQ